MTAAPTLRLAHPADVAGALAFVALCVATWPILAAVGSGLPPRTALVAHVTGMLAGYGVLVLILLVARTPRLERDVGADTLARWHARAARWILVLVLVHAVTATIAVAHLRMESPWRVLTLPWLPAATVATVLMVCLAAVSVRQARARIAHERWHGLHLLMYVAIALGFAHQLAGPDFVGHRWLQVAWALAYVYVFAAVIRYRVIAPLRQASQHRMRVAAVRSEADGVVSILVEGQHLDELKAEAGQFFRWRFLTPDHWWNAHPFSLSAVPSGTQLRLTVKSLGDGSTNLQRLPIGTWVVAEGPYGAMTSARRTRRGVLLIAGGVGITPMRALFETLSEDANLDVVLLYRARTEAELVFKEELDAIAARRKTRVVYLLGNNRAVLSAKALRHNIPDLAARDVYMCGPPPFSSSVRAALFEAGLPQEQLHEERFEF